MSTGTILRRRSRMMLWASASVVALAVASPALAADLNMWTKAPVLDRGEWRGFIEGGVFWTGGDRVPYNGGFGAFQDVFGNSFPAGTISGCDSEFGLGCRGRSRLSLRRHPLARQHGGPLRTVDENLQQLGQPVRLVACCWAVGVSSNCEGAGNSCSFVGAINSAINSSFGFSATAVTVPELVESHWQADFGMGYDFLRGAQINFGFRVAEIRSDITAVTNFQASGATGNGDGTLSGFSANATISTVDRRAFFGAGPRLGLTGSVPLFGAVTFDYNGDVAILYGNTKYSSGTVFGFNRERTRHRRRRKRERTSHEPANLDLTERRVQLRHPGRLFLLVLSELGA